MFGLIASGNTAATANQENTINTIADPDVTSQNNNFIFTGPYRLLADLITGVSSQYGRYSVAEWNGRGRPNIFAVNPNLNPTSPLFWERFADQVLMLPQNQQIQPYITNTLASGTEQEYVLQKIATADWKANQPPTNYWDLIVQATATVTPVVGSWVLSNAITFDVTPLGGVYLVLGAQCIGARGIAFRLNFPRTRMYLGRRLRPGNCILNLQGIAPDLSSRVPWGEDGVWGGFHTFEPPTLDILGTAASSTTYRLFMKCRFLGESLSLLDNWIQTPY